MGTFDIFALPLELRDDTYPDSYTDLDGNQVVYTPDRIARQVNNLMSGHHAGCGMDDCDMVEHPASFMYPEPVMIPRCALEGPTNPRLREENARREAEIEAKMRQEMPEAAQHIDAVAKRRLGFDIRRK